MKRTPLVLAWAFTLLGLVAAAEALSIHHRLLTDPTYRSFCDVSTTISCSQVYLSAYGSVLGVPVALWGLLWWAFVALLLLLALLGPSGFRESLAGYLFAVSTVGLAVVLYLAYAAFFILKTVCLMCLLTYVGVIGLFIVSGIATPFAMITVPRRAIRDLRSLVTSPASIVLVLVFAAGAASALAFFREGAPVSALQPIPDEAGNQSSEFERWYAEQPRVNVPVSNEGAAVLIVKFTDFQCPGCGQTHFSYKPILAKYESMYPGAVKQVTKHFPLDATCNPSLVQSTHPGVCTAHAIAVLAARQGRGQQMEDWLYANQQSMNPISLRQAAAQVGSVTNLEASLPQALEVVKSDVALGRLLRVRQTPTFFINGTRIEGGIQPQFLEAAIAFELKKAGVAK
ncbi:MAG: vitamin K epoxide reductase family protein [Vicinamibacterales bacterium]